MATDENQSKGKVTRCRWCLDLGSYEVFELPAREYPVTKLEWELHSLYLYEGLLYRKYSDELTLEEVASEKATGIHRRGVKLKDVIITFNELIRVYPDGGHRDAYVRSFSAHCHLCGRRFQKEHDSLTKKIASCTDSKDLSGSDLHRVDLARLWGK